MEKRYKRVSASIVGIEAQAAVSERFGEAAPTEKAQHGASECTAKQRDQLVSGVGQL